MYRNINQNIETALFPVSGQGKGSYEYNISDYNNKGIYKVNISSHTWHI
jgi:hypothetical protein